MVQKYENMTHEEVIEEIFIVILSFQNIIFEIINICNYVSNSYFLCC